MLINSKTFAPALIGKSKLTAQHDGPRDGFRSLPSTLGMSPKWEIAKLRQALPGQVERTGFAELSEMLDQHGMGQHKGTLKKAYQLAEKAHAGVMREEGTPYIHHPARVCATLIKEGGVRDVAALSAAILHDVVEDSPTTLDDIKAQFGERTATYVDWLTKPEASGFSSKEARNRFQAKRIANAPQVVRMVKVADRLDNISDLHLLPQNGKMERYLKDTRENYLPLAKETSAPLFTLLSTRVAQLERLAQLQQAA